MVSLQTGVKKLEPNAGIAIGPILFIIAILAILAAAIAAGSGSFTSGTSTESNRTKSSALIQIGENLKVGMDNIVMSVGIQPTSVNMAVNATNGTSDLFSPTGGGIAPPSVGMANNPAVDVWTFPEGIIAGLGTGTEPDIVAVLPVSEGVCAEINNRSIGSSVVPPGENLGTFVTAGTNGITGTSWPTNSGTWTTGTGAAASAASLVGVATGCVNNTGVTVGTSGTTWPTSNYFFYQVLAIQ